MDFFKTVVDIFTPTTTFGQVIYGIIGGVIILYLWLWPIHEYTIPFRNLPGPPNDDWFWGCVPTILKCEPRLPPAKWIDRYGPSVRYRAFLGLQRFVTIDPMALQIILKPDLFPKPRMMNYNLDILLGNGLLVAHGEDHKRQRRALNISFSLGTVKNMMPAFYDKADELKDKLVDIVNGVEYEKPAPTPQKPEDIVNGGCKIDVLRYLSRATLDLIGVCGFDYDFKALSERGNQLSQAYVQMFQEGLMENYGAVLRTFMPALRYIPTERTKTIDKAKEITRQFGIASLFANSKASILAEHADGIQKSDVTSKDLISILIKSNMAADVSPENRLTDEEILNQITTFMLAGNETSSTALTWILYTLSQHKDAQTRLREEVMSVTENRPSLDTLNTLTYMEAVVREVLRLYPPVPVTLREAADNTVVPLKIPVKGRDGKMMENVTISKGTITFVPILIANRSSLIWGPDADQFKPERFLHEVKGQTDKDPLRLPGSWGNLMTFLGGVRNCIGFRFALAEIKVILFVLMKNFEFDLLNSKPDIQLTSSIVLRPKVRGEEEYGLQMPLMVKPLAASV
nr:hypothetical protein L203_01569 [Cryptococcus depauperatus CBS 7841]